MTFPVVAATNTSTSAATTSHSVSLPASISAGDLLIIGLMIQDDALTSLPGITTPTGWTLLATVADNSNVRRLSLFYRVADGNEGASVAVSSSVTSSGAHNSYRITGYTSTPTATAAGPEILDPDPPSHAPGLGALDFLWLAWGGAGDNSADLTAPTNYTNIIQILQGTNVLGSARRELNASSENPAAFGGSATGGLSATVAIEPIAGQPAVKRMGGVPYAHSLSHGILGGKVW